MEVIFYEKTGCINNTKQKKMLREKGHEVKSIDLIEHNWTVDALKLFFNGGQVKDWFNMSAPRIKSGEFDPVSFDAENALKEMVKDHFLIKRPLLQVGDKFAFGFDSGLAKDLLSGENIGHLLNCPNLDKDKSCD